jgi:glycosyltransferase involved in cell wall biosynthesis
LHIAYFSNQFADREGHGVARYSRQLFRSLRNIRPEMKVTPVAAWSSCEVDEIKRMQKEHGLYLLPWGRWLTPRAWTFLNWPPIELWLGDTIDLVHAAYLGYPIATRKPYVVTIHDLGPLTHPEFFSDTMPWIIKRSLKQAIAKAGAIICVSRSTANELENYAGKNLQNLIHIVHEGVSPEFFVPGNADSLKSLPGLPQAGTPFILAAGKISPRKNVARVMQALSKITDQIPHHLVLVGADGWDMEGVKKELDNPRIAGRVHFTGYVTDEQLRALYRSASAYVHISLFEGFGLTVLEAMAAGCPVVTSNVSSLPEVAGDAALLVDPYDVDSIAEAIQSLCSDSSLASDLAKRGRTRARTFTWERCAEQVACIYRNVVARK